MELDTVVCGDALEVMASMPADSVNLIATDPPYFRVKGERWDRQWDNPAAFLDWIGQLCEQWQRILKPNGSLYVFASPEMADRVSVKIREWFNVLNRIRWIKEEGWHKKTVPEKLHSYLSPYEEIIFAEHGSDGVCEPIRAYLASEWERAGLTFEDARQAVGCANGSGLPSHWFTHSQWMLITEENYLKLRRYANNHNHGGEYLRREHEDLRRPFNATPDALYTDVWTFKTVSSYPGKHPCEKPLDLMEHIVRMSSKPGSVVADFFMGSGTTAVAALKTGRHWFGCDISQVWVDEANRRVERTRQELTQMELTF